MVGTHIVSRTLAICTFVVGLGGRMPAPPRRGRSGESDRRRQQARRRRKGHDAGRRQQLKFEVKTKKNGEIMQIGCRLANTKSPRRRMASRTKNSHISLDMAEVNLTLRKAGRRWLMSKEDRAKAEAKVRASRPRIRKPRHWPTPERTMRRSRSSTKC